MDLYSAINPLLSLPYKLAKQAVKDASSSQAGPKIYFKNKAKARASLDMSLKDPRGQYLKKLSNRRLGGL